MNSAHLDMLRICEGDVLFHLATLPDESVHCCVTSPPYWGLRDYGVAGQIGLEATPQEYVAKMVEVFAEIRRVLRPDGTCWINLGDCYASVGGAGWQGKHGARANRAHTQRQLKRNSAKASALKPKDLCGIPWRVALALQADGWWLRQDIIWHKPNPMPESVTDRCTKAHEYVFLLTKSARYWWDQETIAEPPSESYANDIRWDKRATDVNYKHGYAEALAQNPKAPHRVFNGERRSSVNRRSVWTIATQAYPEAHFATFPEELPKLCIMAGCPPGGTVLDPFAGSGTVGKVALELGRKAILIELNPKYCELIRQRCAITPGFVM